MRVKYESLQSVTNITSGNSMLKYDQRISNIWSKTMKNIADKIFIKSGFLKLKSKDGGKISAGCGEFLGENNIAYFFVADDEVIVSIDINIHQLAKVCNDYNLSYKNNVIEPWIKVMLWEKG